MRLYTSFEFSYSYCFSLLIMKSVHKNSMFVSLICVYRPVQTVPILGVGKKNLCPWKEPVEAGGQHLIAVIFHTPLKHHYQIQSPCDIEFWSSKSISHVAGF